MSVEIEMDAYDFERLWSNSTEWSGLSWEDQVIQDRFEHTSSEVEYDHPPMMDWKYAYWLDSNYASVILARNFLRTQEFGCEVLYDTAAHPSGELLGYVLLTNYASPCYRKEAAT